MSNKIPSYEYHFNNGDDIIVCVNARRELEAKDKLKNILKDPEEFSLALAYDMNGGETVYVEGEITESDSSCRHCGCTDDKACVTEHGTCHWVDVGLCSACYEKGLK